MKATDEQGQLNTIEDKFLQSLIEKGIREIKPKRVGHKIVYIGLEDTSVDVPENQKIKLLKTLTLKGYLKEKDYDSVILCPSCSSSQIFSRYNCPHCESKNLKKIQLIEHLACGYIGDRSEFDKENGLVCPKCGTDIGVFIDAQSKIQSNIKNKIKVIGTSFECLKCGNKFEKPLVIHTCENCSTDFSYREAKYEPLPSYEITEKIIIAPNKKSTNQLDIIEKLLTENGYMVELNTKIVGKSGFEQNFDLIAKKGKEQILLDVSGWGSQNDLISLLGKKMDVNAKAIILLDLAGNPTLSTIGKQYNIMVLNGKDEKLLETFTHFLSDIEKDKNDKRPGFLRKGKQ